MNLFLQLAVNGIYAGSIFALFGLSFALIFATTKVWHFAQGAVYSGSALIVVALATTIGLLPAILAGVVFATLGGLGCQAGIYGPLRRRGASMLVIVMASLGVTIVGENLLSILFGPSQKTLLVDVGGPIIAGGIVISRAQIIAPIIAVAVVGLALFVLYRTDFGRKVQALIGDEELMQLQGISTGPIRMACVAFGSAILPIAAVMLLLSGTGVSPYIGLPVVLIGAMSLFLGGINSMLGAAIGGFLIGFVENVALYFIPSSWQAAFTYSLFLAIILVRPTGLLGRRLIQSSM